MTSITRRLRSLVIALAVLALSAGVALAGRGVLSHPTVAPNTSNASDQGDQDEQGDKADAPETEAPEAPETETPDAPEAPDATDSGTGDASTGVHPDNHGKLVSEAAQLVTPAGFDNHGAYVRTIAQDNAGHAASTAAKAKHTKTTH